MRTVTQPVWEQDFQNVSMALSPYQRTTEDGFSYVDPSAPEYLANLYRTLVGIGYANGWLP